MALSADSPHAGAIGDEMAKGSAEETATEKKAIQQHEALTSAKSKEIAAHTKAIEEKMVRWMASLLFRKCL